MNGFKNVVFIYNGNLFSHKDEILSFVRKWMELEEVILSEGSQAQKAKAMCFLSWVKYRPSTNTSSIIYK
jgi:hypothetical protein